jgi:flagellar basal-body rod protein FlgB
LQPVHLFGLAARHAEWLSVRQAVITGNVANANTPGFRAREVEAFEDVLDSTHLTMARTAPGHVNVNGVELGTTATADTESWDVSYSGNSVSLDQELVKADEVSRAFSLDAGLVKAFHRMFLASVRSGS